MFKRVGDCSLLIVIHGFHAIVFDISKIPERTVKNEQPVHLAFSTKLVQHTEAMVGSGVPEVVILNQ